MLFNFLERYKFYLTKVLNNLCDLIISKGFFKSKGFIYSSILRFSLNIIINNSKYLKVFIEALFVAKRGKRFLNYNNIDLHIYKYKFLKKINFSLDEGIFNLYKYINKINPLIFVILGGIFIFISKYSNNSLLFIYLYKICFSIAINIKWIIITHDFIKNQEFKKNYLNLYSPIRYLLLGMLFIYLTIMVIISFNLINYLIHLIWNMIWAKIKGLKIWNSINTGFSNNKPPKKPQNSNIPFYTQEDKNIKKKALEMKQKLLRMQSDKLNTNDLSMDCRSKSMHSNLNKKWKHNIVIEKREDLSLNDQLDKVQFELEAYNNQKKKFQQSINNIKKSKENFYPDEAKYLWRDYIEVIKSLKFNLKSMKNNLKKQGASSNK